MVVFAAVSQASKNHLAKNQHRDPFEGATVVKILFWTGPGDREANQISQVLSQQLGPGGPADLKTGARRSRAPFFEAGQGSRIYNHLGT